MFSMHKSVWLAGVYLLVWAAIIQAEQGAPKEKGKDGKKATVTATVTATLKGATKIAAGGMSLHSIEWKLLQYTNAERSKRGLAPLTLDSRLQHSARRHTAWMTNHRSLRHSRIMGGENIAMGQRSCAQVIRDWMRSPGHRANMLNRSYRRLGVAAYTTPGGTIYWCQQFN